MNDCVSLEIREALPDLIHGRLSGADRVMLMEHVESCADCRAELEVLRQVRDSMPLAPAIDVARIVAALPAPVADLVFERAADAIGIARAPRLRLATAWKLAAALAIVASAGLAVVAGNQGGGAVSIAGSRDVAVQGDRTTALAANAVKSPYAAEGIASQATGGAGMSDAPRQVASLTMVTGVQDLSDEHLELLLSEMDAVESLPSGEPEVLTISLDSIEGGE